MAGAHERVDPQPVEDRQQPCIVAELAAELTRPGVAVLHLRRRVAANGDERVAEQDAHVELDVGATLAVCVSLEVGERARELVDGLDVRRAADRKPARFHAIGVGAAGFPARLEMPSDRLGLRARDVRSRALEGPGDPQVQLRRADSGSECLTAS